MPGAVAPDGLQQLAQQYGRQVVRGRRLRVRHPPAQHRTARGRDLLRAPPVPAAGQRGLDGRLALPGGPRRHRAEQPLHQLPRPVGVEVADDREVDVAGCVGALEEGAQLRGAQRLQCPDVAVAVVPVLPGVVQELGEVEQDQAAVRALEHVAPDLRLDDGDLAADVLRAQVRSGQPVPLDAQPQLQPVGGQDLRVLGVVGGGPRVHRAAHGRHRRRQRPVGRGALYEDVLQQVGRAGDGLVAEAGPHVQAGGDDLAAGQRLEQHPHSVRQRQVRQPRRPRQLRHDLSSSPRRIENSTWSCHRPPRHWAARSTPSRVNPAFSSARCSARLRTSVQACTRSARVWANR